MKIWSIPLINIGKPRVSEIDLDFSGDSCKKVLRFLHNTYGEERVASIGRFGTNKTKGTIRDMAKVLGINLATADAIAKSFGENEIDEIDKMISGELDTTPSAKEAIECVAKYPDLFRYVRKLCGLPKSFGLHPCGRVIATRDLEDFLPSCYDKDGIRFLQGDMHDVEDMGLVKIDVLGLRTLDQEYDTLEMSNESLSFINPKQSLDDPKVLEIFKKGDTLGIFQMASPGMRKTIQKVKPTGIEDISAINALFRPGSIGHIDEFCDCKAGKREISYLHPDLEPILKNTYGVIVFQEQVIEIGRLAGLHNPDELRKATAKKKAHLLAKIKPELEAGLKARGWTDEQFNLLWINMLDFAGYAFNKCVSGDTEILLATNALGINAASVEDLFALGDSLRKKFGLDTAYSMSTDGAIHPNHIKGVYCSWIAKTFRIDLDNEAFIVATGLHKFPTPSGVKYLCYLKPGDALYHWDKKTGTLSEQKIIDIAECDTEPVFDIEMDGPDHNFVTSTGIVTSNSHSSAYGIIAYMTAKQKAYYPAEFYAGLCNSYIGESSFVANNAEEIVNDIRRHGISIAPFDFRQDHRRCSVKGKKLLWAIPLVMDLNEELGEILYSFKDAAEPYFWRLARDMNAAGITPKRLETLIKLGAFHSYGKEKKLFRIIDLLNTFKFGERKQVSKDSYCEGDPLYTIVAAHSSGTTKKGEPSKKFTIQDCDAILDECEDYLNGFEYDDLDMKTWVLTQKELLGFVGVTGRQEDRPKLYVKAIYPLHRKKDGVQFGYSVVGQSIGSGKETRYTVFNAVYKKDPVGPGDIIQCLHYVQDGPYFTMEHYRRIA